MSELVHNLGIDWKVLVAQVVNFAILLFLLRKFAYRPILKILNDRREKIEEAIKRSRTVDEKLADIEKLKQQVLKEARVESSVIIKEAQKAAAGVRDEMLAQAHQKAAHLILDAEKKIEVTQRKMHEEMKEDIAGVVLAAVEKTVGEVLDKKSRATMVEQAVHLIKTPHR